jgi:DNA-binding transcriptional MerR regulator
MDAPSPGKLSAKSMVIPDKLYFRIGDVAELLSVKPYVLRYWESEFPMISPQKTASGQRVYRKSDVETVIMIKHLLYEERYSIEGARRRIKDLRKGGSLKSFMAETAKAPAQTPLTSQDTVSAPFESTDFSQASGMQRNEEIQSAIAELELVARKPISQIFSD